MNPAYNQVYKTSTKVIDTTNMYKLKFPEKESLKESLHTRILYLQEKYEQNEHAKQTYLDEFGMV